METKIRTLRDKLESHKQSLVVRAAKEGPSVVEAISDAFSAALQDRKAFNSFEKVHQWTDGDCPTRYSLKFDNVILNELSDWITHFEHAKGTYEEWSNSRAALDHYRDKVADLQSKERSSLSSGKALSSAMREKMMRNNNKLDSAEREFAAKRETLLKEVRTLRQSAAERLDTLLLRLMQWEQSWLKDMYVAVNNGYKDAIEQLQQRKYDTSALSTPAASAGTAGGATTPQARESSPTPKAGAVAASVPASASPRTRRSTGKLSLGKAAPRAAEQPAAFEPFGDAAAPAPAGHFDPFGATEQPSGAFEPRAAQDDLWGDATPSASPSPAAEHSQDLWGDATPSPAVATKPPAVPASGNTDLDDLFGTAPSQHESGAFTAPAAASASFDPFGDTHDAPTKSTEPAHFDPFA